MQVYHSEFFSNNLKDTKINLDQFKNDPELIKNYLSELSNRCLIGFNETYHVIEKNNLECCDSVVQNNTKSSLTLKLGRVSKNKKKLKDTNSTTINLHDRLILLATQNIIKTKTEIDHNYLFTKIDNNKPAFVHICKKYYTTIPKTHFGPEYELKNHIIYVI